MKSARMWFAVVGLMAVGFPLDLRADDKPSTLPAATTSTFATATPTTAPAVAPTTMPDVVITIDASEAPELKDWAENTLKPVLVAWYPKIVAEIPVDGHPAPDHFSIRFDPKYKGVAETGGTRVRANPKWISDNLKGESIGALLHEEVHVVQQPYHSMRGKHMPTWLLEGTCDYIRWFHYESNHPHPHGDKPKYDDSYRVSATFIKYVMEKYDPKLIQEMNAANYKGVYTDDLWKQFTGKTVQELGDEWKQSIK